MEGNAVQYNAQGLWITRSGQTSRVEVAEIVAVSECQMLDEIVHADEGCHILRMRDSFWLIGPFVEGMSHALHALLHDHPDLQRQRMKLSRMPRRMRAPGLFGWRLWPIAGLGHYPNTQLKQLRAK